MAVKLKKSAKNQCNLWQGCVYLTLVVDLCRTCNIVELNSLADQLSTRFLHTAESSPTYILTNMKIDFQCSSCEIHFAPVLLFVVDIFGLRQAVAIGAARKGNGVGMK